MTNEPKSLFSKKKKKQQAVCAFKSSCGGCSLGTRLKPSTCILADDQKEILSPYCCQFQFIRGKCHLLILTTMHNGRRSKLCERGQYSWAVGYVVMSAAKKKTESWTRGFCVTLGCSQVPLCSLPPPPKCKTPSSLAHKELARNRPWRNLFERETH